MLINQDRYAHSTTHHTARTKPWRVEYKLERTNRRPMWVADTFTSLAMAIAFAKVAVEQRTEGCVYAVVSDRRDGWVYDSYGWNGVD